MLNFSKLKPVISFPDKKSLIFLLIVIIVAFFFGALVYYFSQTPAVKETIPPLSKEEMLIKKQLRELEELREQAGAQPLTAEEINKQIQELDILRAKSKPLTQEQIQKQLEELEKLRQLSK